MKSFKFLLVAAMLMVSATGFAQFAKGGSSTGIVKSYDRVAVSYNSYKFSFDYENIDDIGLSGVGAEWIHGFSLSSSIPIYLETGLKFIYAYKSEDYAELEVDDEENIWIFEGKNTINVMNIAVPVNLAYRFYLPNKDFSVTPFTGITFKGNLLAKEKIEIESENYEKEINLFSKKDMGGSRYTAKRIQVGWQIGAGLSYKALYFGLSYGLDFTDFAKRTKTSNFAVSLGYNF